MNSSQQPIFKALADPTRRQILHHLSEADLTIGQVCENFSMTRGAIKKHLSILEKGQLIFVRTSGRERINSLNPQGLKSASDWLKYFDRFWDTKLGDLKSAIENHQNKPTGNDTK